MAKTQPHDLDVLISFDLNNFEFGVLKVHVLFVASVWIYTKNTQMQQQKKINICGLCIWTQNEKDQQRLVHFNIKAYKHVYTKQQIRTTTAIHQRAQKTTNKHKMKKINSV